MSTGLAEVVPPVVAAEERFTDPPDVVLFDAERALLARAVDKRRREFATVRHCARRALAALGHPPVALLPGERGAPQWPAGVVGSMTHCAGYRAAAVARASDVLTIGIDAEPHVALPDGVLAAIALPQERARLAQLHAAERSVCWDRLLFSAKESLYKAWFPLTRRWLDFEQALVTIDPVGRTFSARLLVPGPTVHGRSLQTFRGRWRLHDELVLTAITVLAQPAAGTAGPAAAR
jgi:4'-phosphopantetheinyl transferase EntD